MKTLTKSVRTVIAALAIFLASGAVTYLYRHGLRFELVVGALLVPIALGLVAAVAIGGAQDPAMPAARHDWVTTLRLVGIVVSIGCVALLTHFGWHWYGLTAWAVTAATLAGQVGTSVGMGDAAREHLVLAERISHLERWLVALAQAQSAPPRQRTDGVVHASVGGVVYELHTEGTLDDLDREGPFFDHDADLTPKDLDQMEEIAVKALVDVRPVVLDLADAVLRLVHPAREQLFPETTTPPGDERMQVVLGGAVSREDVERAITTLDAS